MASINELKENAMSTGQDRNAESRNPTRIAAAIMFLVLVGSGYAISTQVESAVESGPVVAQAGQQDAAPTVYFPAQYVNQAKTVEPHIEAF